MCTMLAAIFVIISLHYITQLTALFPPFFMAVFGRLDSVHWDGSEWRGWVREGSHTGEANQPSVTPQQPPLHHHGHAPTALLSLPRPCFSFFGPNHHSAASTNLPSLRHGHPLPVEAVFPEVGLLPGQFWLHLGDDAAALHHPATGQPREQRRAEAADPGPQQALHKGSGWGEPERHGRAVRGHHDSLRWVIILFWTGSVLTWCHTHIHRIDTSKKKGGV